MAYAMLDGALRVHSRLEDGHGLGAGASAGVLLPLGARVRAHGYARVLHYFTGENDTPAALGLEGRLSLASNLVLRLDLARQREAGHSFDRGSISVMLYH